MHACTHTRESSGTPKHPTKCSAASLRGWRRLLPCSTGRTGVRSCRLPFPDSALLFDASGATHGDRLVGFWWHVLQSGATALAHHFDAFPLVGLGGTSARLVVQYRWWAIVCVPRRSRRCHVRRRMGIPPRPSSIPPRPSSIPPRPSSLLWGSLGVLCAPTKTRGHSRTHTPALHKVPCSCVCPSTV